MKRYRFAEVMEPGDGDGRFLPQLVDRAGTVRWESGEQSPLSLLASAVFVYAGGVERTHQMLRVRNVSFVVHVTDRRVIAVCRRFDKGGGWWGNSLLVPLFNVVSQIRAAIRQHGLLLAGHVPLASLTAVGFQPARGWLGRDMLRLVVLDESGGRVYVDLRLAKDVDGAAVARHIARHVATRRGVAEPGFPATTPDQRTYSLVTFTGAERVGAEGSADPALAGAA